MTIETSLQKYTAARDALQDHVNRNPEFYKQNNALVMAIVDAENELRDDAALAGVGTENASYKVTVTPVTMKSFDEEKIKTALASNPALLAECIKDQTRPARITISPVRSPSI